MHRKLKVYRQYLLFSFPFKSRFFDSFHRNFEELLHTFRHEIKL